MSSADLQAMLAILDANLLRAWTNLGLFSSDNERSALKIGNFAYDWCKGEGMRGLADGSVTIEQWLKEADIVRQAIAMQVAFENESSYTVLAGKAYDATAKDIKDAAIALKDVLPSYNQSLGGLALVAVILIALVVLRFK